MRWLKNLCGAVFAIGIFFNVSVVSAEIYTGEGEYTMSKYETVDVAEQRAIKDAMRYAIEQAGIYIESYSHEKNFKLLEDEVITIASGILKFVEKPIIKKTFMEDGSSIKIYASIKVEIEDSDIDKWQNKSLEQRTQINSQLEALRKANAEQDKRIKELETQIAAGIDNPQAENIIKAEFANEDKIFLSNHKIEEGWRCYSNGDYTEAVALFAEALKLNPTNADIYYGRGTTYIRLKNYKDALSDLNKSIELNGNFAAAYHNRGIVYYELKNYERAIADNSKAIELDPENSAAYNNRGTVYNDLQEYEKAIPDYDKTLKLNPTDSIAYYNRGTAYFYLKNYERAISDYSKAIELNPNFVDAYNNRGYVYYELQNYEHAIADYNQAITINPNNAGVYGNRGILYTRLKNYKKALSDLNRAIQLGTDDGEAYYDRGICYKALGENKKAEADFAKAKELGYKAD